MNLSPKFEVFDEVRRGSLGRGCKNHVVTGKSKIEKKGISFVRLRVRKNEISEGVAARAGVAVIAGDDC